MALMSFADLRMLWINAGGNPQRADEAASFALARSGGNPSATNGLWGVSSAVTNPLDDARSAIQVSNNGRDFSALSKPNPFDPPGTLLDGPVQVLTNVFGGSGIGGTIGSFLGFDKAATFLISVVVYVFMMLAGSALMFAGLLMMIVGAKKTRELASAGFGTVLAGVGFGVGGNVGSRAGRKASSATEDLPPTSGVPAAPVSPTPSPRPSGGFFTSEPSRRGVRWTAPTKQEPVLPPSEGGPVHPRRKRRLPSPKSPVPVRVGEDVLFFPRGSSHKQVRT